METIQSLANPFVYARAINPNEGIARGAEVEELLNLVRGGHNTTLYAPRRMGKTTLLKQLLAAAQDEGLATALVDLSNVLTLSDVATRLEQGFRGMPGRFRRFADKELGSISIGINVPLLGVTVGRQPRSKDLLPTIHSLLEVPARVAERSNSRAVVVLDEFQALVALEGLDGVFRSHLQHHNNVTYIYSGSEQSLLHALFHDRARPFYAQAGTMRLGRLSYELAYDFLEQQFQDTGKDCGEAAAHLVHAAAGHPQRLMLLAYHLWQKVEPDRPASVSDLRLAYETALRSITPELRPLIDSLSANERRVIAALSVGLSPFETVARDMTGLKSHPTAQRAVDSLCKKAIIERDEDNQLAIVDPLLAPWLINHETTQPHVYVIPDNNGTFRVTDGPHLRYIRGENMTLEDAQLQADQIASQLGSAAVTIIDSHDPNDIPGWAVEVED